MLRDSDQSTPQDPRVGTVLSGRYRVLDRLASGGIGVVYRGERIGLGRAVAIKFLHAAFSGEQGLLKRFEREAQALSRIAHPHCVSIIDYGVEEGAPYLVMDYVRGQTLRDLLDAGRVPVPRALAIVRQLLAGLDHCHQQGIVHRDVKPANIMLTEVAGTGDHVQILDFGLAKLRDSASDLSVGSIAIGTPSYMPPEQASGEPVDARSDVYAVGTLLYEMLAGRKPFEADQAFEVIAMHASKPPPPLRETAADLELPPGLEAVIRRAMAKAPKDRFQTAGEMLGALEKAGGRARTENGAVPASRGETDLPFERTEMASVDSLSRPPAAPARKRRGLAWLGLLAAAGAGATVLAYQRVTDPSRTRSVPRQNVVAPRPPDAAVVSLPAEPVVPVTLPPVPPPVPEATPPDASPPDAAIPDAAVPDAAVPDAAIPDAAAPVEGAENPELPDDERDEPVGEVVEIIGDDQVDTPAPQEPEAAPAVEVKNTNDVLALIRAGKRSEAIAGLHKLRRESPKNAYIHYLLGNLYFERYWWTDAMASYREGIRHNPAYRRRGVMIKNVIRAMGSKKTYAKASYFLRKDVGAAAFPYLRRAAKSDKDAKVRARAALLLKQMSRRR